jgi:choice-of-anchor C domain-containing protein
MAGNPELLPGLGVVKRLRASIGANAQEFSFDASGKSPSNMGWSERAMDFTADAPLLKLSFVSLVANFGGPALDRVSIDAVNTPPPPPPPPPPPGLLVANGSFEMGINPEVDANLVAPDAITIDAWTVEGGSIDYIGTRWQAGDGVRCLDLSGTGPGTVSQVVTGLVAGQNYRLTFLMAGNPELLPGLGVIKRLRASIGTNSQDFSFDASGKSGSNMGWTENAMDFTAGASSLKLSFASLVNNIGGPALDRVAIQSASSPPNHPPVAIAQSIAVLAGHEVEIHLNSQDSDGDVLTYLVETPANGALSGTAPNLTYTPNAGFSGPDSFTFKVNDGQLDSAEAAVAIFVVPLPDTNGLVVNGGFEVGLDPGVSTNLSAPDAATIPGWTVEGGNIDYIGSRWAAGDGVRCVDLSGEGPGTISQVIAGLTVGQRYRLSFAMAGNPELLPGLGVVKRLRVSVGAEAREFSFDATGKSPVTMGWTEKSMDFTAQAPSVQLSFVSLVQNIGGPALDRVVITAIENEPPPPPPPATLVANGSFELGVNPGVGTNFFAPNSTAIDGWNVDAGSIDYIGTRWLAGDGLRCVDLSGEGPGSISQIVAGLSVGQRYRLSFLMAGNPELLPSLGTIKRLRASIGTNSHEFSFDASGRSPNDMGWVSKTMDFIAQDSSLVLSFSSLVPNFGGPALDHVTLQGVEAEEDAAPIALAQAIALEENSTAPIVLAGDGPTGSTLTYIVGAPTHGKLIGVPPYVVYCPSPNYRGVDSFAFRVSNGQVESAEAVVSISVREVPSTPVAVAALGGVTDIDGQGTWLAVAPDGTNANIFLDGSRSFDPNGDVVEFRWYADGNYLPIAGTMRATNVFELGEHTVILQVNDASIFAGTTIGFEVLSIDQALDELSSQILGSTLLRSQKRPLLASIQAVQTAFQASRRATALNHLSALRQKITAQVGPRDPDSAGRWITFVDAIVTAGTPRTRP